jgi:hypothetical protein
MNKLLPKYTCEENLIPKFHVKNIILSSSHWEIFECDLIYRNAKLYITLFFQSTTSPGWSIELLWVDKSQLNSCLLLKMIYKFIFLQHNMINSQVG